MATYKYGSWVGAQAAGKVTHRAFLAYTLSTNNATTYKLTVSSGVDLWNSAWTSVNTTCDLTARTAKYIDLTTSADKYTFYSSQAFTYTKGHSAVKKTINATSKVTGVDADAGGSSVNGKTSTASYTFTVPAKTHYTVSFNANGGSGAPSSQTKWYGETLTLSSTKPTKSGYVFVGWATSQARANAGTVDYKSGAKYTANAGATLYAAWSVTNPPTCKGKIETATIRQGFDSLVVSISGIDHYDGRSISSIVVSCNGKTATGTTEGEYTISGFTDTDRGEQEVTVKITDNASPSGAYSVYNIGTVDIVAPSWEKTVTINGEMPPIDINKTVTLDEVQVYNYITEDYETVTATGYKATDNNDGTWTTAIRLNENQVPQPPSETADISAHPVKISYRHYDSNVSESGNAFYTTSRNQNYSNGIYNVMFVGGCDSEAYPNHTSRVWWSKINNPLYFPDTNYVEVGSNDTAVQGLTKVGDYLAVIKQSKTTDTAIFLLYPTSFEEETTYAVKQGVQGVGALSRYSFNILGDETLFLSPKGVMAIVPTDDEEHKVQNRSYFVDKRLLAEPEIKKAYSFVYDGKYYLSIGNGHVYVLDGNQRNSWGNDRTNLVYECYFLNNIPATCFIKYNDMLVFSNDVSVCAFGTGFTDEYDMETNEENVPVKAEWSTIFDDDGALHYYKTMQKKGNVVSILPTDYKYTAEEVDESTFYENPELYYTYADGVYTQCDDETVYDDEETYYVRDCSSTKVLVRKDGNEPVEILRKFSESSQIPSEMMLNKKFKKYKRLQFIIRNEEDEDFGVDEIIKNYTVQNYAKK